MLFGLVVGFVSGTTYIQVRQYHHSYIYTNVYVKHKLTDYKYTLAFADTDDEFDTQFCNDYKPTFEEGMLIEKLEFEDRGVCWSVADTKLGYKFARDEHRKIIRIKEQ